MGWGRSFLELGELRQDVGTRHLPMPDLSVAVNVCRTDDRKTLDKRKGTTRTAMTFSGGSLSGTPEVILPGDAGNNYMRDTGGQNWIKSGTSWVLKSSQAARPWVETKVTNASDFTQPRPNAVLVGTSIWQFAVKSGTYEVTVISATTGRAIASPFSVTATSIINLAPVWDGTDLWVLWTNNSDTVKCHLFASGTVTTTPTATNYYTYAGREIQVVDAKWMAGVGKVFVVFGGSTGLTIASPTAFIRTSFLNPATGLSSTTIPSVLAWERSDARYAKGVSGLTIASGQDAFTTGFQYFAVTDLDSTAAQALWLGRGYAYASNLSGVFRSEGKGFASSLTVPERFIATISAVATTDASNGSAVVYVSVYDEVSAGGGSANSIVRVQFNAGGGAPTISYPCDYVGWVASAPVLYGGAWYFLSGFDDGVKATTPIQQGYFLRKFSDATIVAQFLMGQGGARGHRNTYVLATADANIAWNALNVPNLVTYGTKIFATVAQTLNIGFVAVSTATIDMAKAYGKPCQAMNRGFIPGNIPMVWGSDGAHEIAPLVAPPWMDAPSAGTYAAAARYVLRDDDGTVWRSAPIVVNSITTGTLTVPSLAHFAGASVAYVEFYVSAAGPPKLQATVLGSPAYDVQYTFTSTLVDGESLDTYGGGLEQTWPIQCQAVGYWRNRVFLAQRNKLFYSKELESGLGPLFNESGLASEWADSQLDINAVATVNFDYLALFAQDRIGVIGGAGPDGLGRGSYTVQTLSTRMGLLMSSCGAVGSGPDGAYFQDAATGRVCLVVPSMQAVEARNGAATSYPISFFVHYETQRLMFAGYRAAPNSYALLLDYANRTEASPYGQLYQWNFTAITMSSACVDSSGVAIIDSDGAIRRIGGNNYYDEVSGGASAAYAVLVQTGRVNPSGLQSEHLLSLVQVLLTWKANSTATVRVIVDNVTTTVKDFSVTSTAYQFGVRPTGAGRMQWCQISIQEMSSVNQGFSIDGIALEYHIAGRPRGLTSGNVK